MSLPTSARHLLVGTLILAVTACGGGGGGGGGGGKGGQQGSATFTLSGASLARAILDFDGDLEQLVNPASLYEVDPLTGVPLPNSPRPLQPGIALAQLATINLEQILDPLTPEIPVVPRNAVIVLDFTRDVDRATLGLDDSDPANPGVITATSTIQVRRGDGSLVDARAFVDGDRVILSGVTEGTIGFEPSPLVLDPMGHVVQNPAGYLRVVLGVGIGALMSTGGDVYGHRADALGSPERPLPFNPGNSNLDAIQLQTEAGIITFNGFLPDLSPPRIIRPVGLAGTITGIQTITLGGEPVVEIEDAGLAADPPNLAANDGEGEWANSLLRITSSDGVTRRYVVESNVEQPGVLTPTFRLAPDTALDPAVAVGDDYTIQRTEFFEPVDTFGALPTDPFELARITVDPENVPRDPDDPQDLLNHDLRYFVRVFDELGVERLDVWDPTTGVFLPIPPRSSLRMRFSEQMDPASFRAYETFYVTDGGVSSDEAGFDRQRVGRVVASADSRELTFEPFLENQFEPTESQFVGFGGTASDLRLVLRTRPELAEISALEEGLDEEALDELVDLERAGVLGINDLGGRGLGVPQALFDQSDADNFLLSDGSAGRGAFPPAIDFEMPFRTEPSDDPDLGVIVHRFMGEPVTASFQYPAGVPHDPITTGVEYADYPPLDQDDDGTVDRRFIYGPVLPDIGLGQRGRLTGASSETIEHIIDNFNKPAVSPFASPNGQDEFLNLSQGTLVPLNSPYGARFQHIYRAGDASPSFQDYNGVILDLVGLAWAPLHGNVVTSRLDELAILVGLSSANMGRGPTTAQQNGIPDDVNSGLDAQFDCNLLEWRVDCAKPILTSLEPFAAEEPPQAHVVTYTPYTMTASALFRPANAPPGSTQFNFYMDFPKFNAGIDPFFGKENVFSYPYDSRFAMVIEYRIGENLTIPSNNNLIRFSPGILTSTLPRFRVWSQGQHPLAHCVPNNTNGAACRALNGTIGASQAAIQYFRAGEGGPLLEPGTFQGDVQPPVPNNGMPTIPAASYILPPSAQPDPDAADGDNTNAQSMGTTPPKCNTDPHMNWYHANGMFAFPLPSTTTSPNPLAPGVFPGPPNSPFYGYDPNAWAPSYNNCPAFFGDNSRYMMLFKYRKRVSTIESPTVLATSFSNQVRYLRPLVDPPLDSVDPNAGLIVELRTSGVIDFSVPLLDSGYVDVRDENFEDIASGVTNGLVYNKFRAVFATAAGSLQPPALDTVIIPYEKLDP